jgi:uncharacterized protein YraI
MLSRLTVTAAILALGATAAAAAPFKLTGDTNLRKAPGTGSEVVGLMPKGETVEVGTCDAGWCKVTWNGNEGYAIGRNVGQAGPVTAQRRAPARRYAGNDGWEPVDPPGTVYEDAPVVYGPPPPYYGYYPYGGPYYYGPGWRRPWHYYRRW